MLQGIWIEGTQDVTSVREMRTKLWGETEAQDDLDPWSRHLLIVENGTILAVGTVLENLHHHFCLKKIGVLPLYRKQGIGDFLIRILINDAWERGAVDLCLTADENNRGFFMKEGFLEKERNEEGIVMLRTL